MCGVAVYLLNANVVSGEPTDLNFNQRCDLDDVEYEAVPDVLYIPSYVALVESQLCLVNLTGDARDLNTVYLSIWNDMEIPLSATLVFNCWFDQPLTAVSPAFDESFLSLLPNDPRAGLLTGTRSRPFSSLKER